MFLGKKCWKLWQNIESWRKNNERWKTGFEVEHQPKTQIYLENYVHKKSMIKNLYNADKCRRVFSTQKIRLKKTNLEEKNGE